MAPRVSGSRAVRATVVATLVFGFACSDTSEPDDAGMVVEPAPDAGGYTPVDGGQLDSSVARRDAGPPPDIGFNDPETFREGDEVIDGLRTHIKLMGSQTSTMPPAVFVADGPGLGHEYLLPHMKQVIEGRTLVFYDARGGGLTSFGDGSGTSTITANEHVTDLGEMLDYLKDENILDTTIVDLVGHGYGGGIAALYAARNPARVSRLALIVPSPANIAESVARDGEQQRRQSSTERERVVAITTRWWECFGNEARCFLQVLDVLAPNEMCNGNEELYADLEFVYGSFRTFWFVRTQLKDSRYDWTSEFANITARTTILDGACDSNPEATNQSYLNAIEGATLHRLENSGFYPMVEEPDAFFFRLRQALDHSD